MCRFAKDLPASSMMMQKYGLPGPATCPVATMGVMCRLVAMPSSRKSLTPCKRSQLYTSCVNWRQGCRVTFPDASWRLSGSVFVVNEEAQISQWTWVWMSQSTVATTNNSPNHLMRRGPTRLSSGSS